MVNPKEYLEMGLKFHGHKCPAMPMGLRAGAAAMNKLGVERTGDSEWLALVEIGENHCATCFADGVQVITGCTFGKGNIKKLNYGKWGLTLINKKVGKAVRVAPKAETMAQNKQSTFFTEYRTKGVPPTKVPAEIVDPLIQRVMNAPEEMLFNVSGVFDYPYQEKKHSFESLFVRNAAKWWSSSTGASKTAKKSVRSAWAGTSRTYGCILTDSRNRAAVLPPFPPAKFPECQPDFNHCIPTGPDLLWHSSDVRIPQRTSPRRWPTSGPGKAWVCICLIQSPAVPREKGPVGRPSC